MYIIIKQNTEPEIHQNLGVRADKRNTFCGSLERKISQYKKMSQKEEIFFSDKSETLIVDIVEHVFHDEMNDTILTLTKLISCVLILSTNVPLLVFIVNQASKTFLDWLIVIDCLLCLSNIESILLDGFRGILRILLNLQVQHEIFSWVPFKYIETTKSRSQKQSICRFSNSKF